LILNEPVRIYSELAPWFHLLTHPASYTDEAAYYADVIDASSSRRAQTLLELGAGGGNNASHLKRRFACTLTDLSSEMLEQSLTINPQCEHVRGDMRTLRLGRTFDAVLVHDAVMHMTSEADLRAAIETAAIHARAGGVVVIAPDVVRETFAAGVDHGGHDGEDGRALRYLEWTYDPDPTDTTYAVDYAIVLHEPGLAPRVELDHHVEGLFPRRTWHELLSEAGLERIEADLVDPFAGEHEVFVARKPTV
jgi:SAM-dependent methyltransferase